MENPRKPGWRSADDWRNYQKQTTKFQTRLLQLLRRELAEARTDLDADRDASNLQREHTVRITVLQCQIADAQGTALYQQPAPRPVEVLADWSQKRHSRNRNRLLLSHHRLGRGPFHYGVRH